MSDVSTVTFLMAAPSDVAPLGVCNRDTPCLSVIKIAPCSRELFQSRQEPKACRLSLDVECQESRVQEEADVCGRTGSFLTTVLAVGPWV